MTRYQWVRQQSGEDCAAASLAIVAKHPGRRIPIDRIRRAVSTGAEGTTFASLRRGAEALGFRTRCIQATDGALDQLGELDLPAIIYWKGYHVVVLYGRRGDRWVVSDPGIGVRYLTRAELLEGWQGRVTLLLRPHPIRFWLEEDAAQRPFMDVLGHLAPRRALWASILGLGLAVCVATFGLAVLLQRFVDRVLVPGDADRWPAYAAGLLALVLARSGAALARARLVDDEQARLASELKARFGMQLLALPLSYHQSRSSGLVRNRLDELPRIASALVLVLAETPVQVGFVVLGGILLAWYDLRLAALMSAVLLLGVLGYAAVLPRMRQGAYRVSASLAETFFLFAQLFSNALTIRVTGARRWMESDLFTALEREAAAGAQGRKDLIAGGAVLELGVGFSLMSLLLICSRLLLRGDLTLGEIVGVAGIGVAVLGGAGALGHLLAHWMEARAASSLLDELLAGAAEDRTDPGAGWVDLSPTGDVQAEGVTFRYEGRPPLFEGLGVRFPG
ncbi:MAG: hypothetical protein FIA95_15150, partial [Gemmatimonadetes bacterium]|nr:hypothetical protein [Gemmatimonadota bacterium]